MGEHIRNRRIHLSIIKKYKLANDSVYNLTRFGGKKRSLFRIKTFLREKEEYCSIKGDAKLRYDSYACLNGTLIFKRSVSFCIIKSWILACSRCLMF